MQDVHAVVTAVECLAGFPISDFGLESFEDVRLDVGGVRHDDVEVIVTPLLRCIFDGES